MLIKKPAKSLGGYLWLLVVGLSYSILYSWLLANFMDSYAKSIFPIMAGTGVFHWITACCGRSLSRFLAYAVMFGSELLFTLVILSPLAIGFKSHIRLAALTTLTALPACAFFAVVFAFDTNQPFPWNVVLQPAAGGAVFWYLVYRYSKFKRQQVEVPVMRVSNRGIEKVPGSE